MTDQNAGRVSVLIPARNEEANIERSVRSVAAQQGILEIIVADDQSTDRTGEILEGLKREIPQLRVVRVDSLPEGWMGKANALANAARAASGEWLLFTDADTEHRPDSLAALLARAETEGVDLLSLSPGQRLSKWWQKAVIPLIYVNLARRYRFEKVSDPKSTEAAANGQYILIRREAYDRAGGHEAVRAVILEDVELARRVKTSGGRILFLSGSAWVETHAYPSFRDMWEGWTKNLYALYGATIANTLTALLDIVLIDWLPLVALIYFLISLLVGLSGEGAAFSERDAIGVGICFAVLVYEYLSYWRALKRLGFKSSAALFLAPGTVIFALLLINSARAHLQDRVRWKGRDYSPRALTKEAR
jgi:chlorobactene glucosyltransferase